MCKLGEKKGNGNRGHKRQTRERRNGRNDNQDRIVTVLVLVTRYF